MKKSTKGAVAAAAAGVLLLGGAGSLAFWSDSDIIGGGTINAGHISLDDTTVGSDDAVTTDDGCANAPFIFDAGESGAHAYVPGTSHIVPGDVLTKICTFNVNASGDHLRATLAATGGAGTGDLAAETTTGAAFTVAGATQTTVTQADNGSEVKATITVTFPYAAATNDSQNDALDVGAYTIALTQVHDAPVAP